MSLQGWGTLPPHLPLSHKDGPRSREPPPAVDQETAGMVTRTELAPMVG